MKNLIFNVHVKCSFTGVSERMGTMKEYWHLKCALAVTFNFLFNLVLGSFLVKDE